MTSVLDLPADASPSSDDLIYVVNNPGGTPGDRKVTLAALAGSTPFSSVYALSSSLGTMAAQNANAVAITGGSISGVGIISSTITGNATPGGDIFITPSSNTTEPRGRLKVTAGGIEVFPGSTTFSANPNPGLTMDGTYTLNGVYNIYGVSFAPIVKNPAASVVNIGVVASYQSTPTIQADSQAITWATATADHFSRIDLSTLGGGTLTASQDYVNFEGYLRILDAGVAVTGTYAVFSTKGPAVTGGTIDEWVGYRVLAAAGSAATVMRGVWVQALTGAGENYAVDIVAPSGGTKNVGIRNLGTYIGPTIYGSESASGALTLVSTTHATLGVIAVNSGVVHFMADQTFTAKPNSLLDHANLYTLNYANAAWGGGGASTAKGLINIAPTLTVQQNAGLFTSIGYKHATNLKNVPSVGVTTFGQVAAVRSVPTITADTDAITVSATADFYSAPTFTRVNGGTLTMSSDYAHFEALLTLDAGVTFSGTYACFAAQEPAGAGALQNYTGFRVAAAGFGSVTSYGLHVGFSGAWGGAGENIGVYIETAPTGGTKNVGILNVGTSRLVGAVTVGSDLAPGAGVALDVVSGMTAIRRGTMTLVNGSNDNVTAPTSSFMVVSGPTGAFTITGIQGGVDGAELQILNLTGQNMSLTNEDALSTAANRITTHTGGTITTTGNGGVRLVYDSGTSRWCSVTITV